MKSNFLTLAPANIDDEHIWCSFYGKKCKEGYLLKKGRPAQEADKGCIFRRLDERAKVFIEYVPAGKAWVRGNAPGYEMIGCFGVSGQYKGQGYAEALLQSAIDDVRRQGKGGLVTVVGTRKLHFMSDTERLLCQGFTKAGELAGGLCLFALKLGIDATNYYSMGTVALNFLAEGADARYDELQRTDIAFPEGIAVQEWRGRAFFVEYFIGNTVDVYSEGGAGWEVWGGVK